MRKTVTLAAAALTALCMMTGASAITEDFTDLTSEDIMAGEVSPDETASYETTDELKTVTIPDNRRSGWLAVRRLPASRSCRWGICPEGYVSGASPDSRR